ncbi:MAG: hypothetical protein KDA87_20975 [Planctomycetales bacterium]|nr:hypothetical protein [Planctomycetales bacterium]
MHTHITDSPGSRLGDTNLDSRFDSADLVSAFQGATYESNQPTAQRVLTFASRD